MGLARTLLLGAIAGVTILLGMPLGRMRRPAPNLRLVLNAVAIGVLLFLVWDVLTHAYAPIDTALGNLREHKAGLAPVVGYGALFAGGLVAGLMSLIYYEWFMGRAGTARRFGRVPWPWGSCPLGAARSRRGAQPGDWP